MPPLSCEPLGLVLPDGHDGLLTAGRNRSVFLSADFLEPWFEVFGARHESVAMSFRHGQDLVGYAPLVVKAEGGVAPFRRLTMAGQHPTSGEYLDLLAAPGAESMVAEAAASELTGRLRRRWDVLTIQRVLSDSLVMGALGRALEGRGCPVEVIPSGVSPYLSLPSGGQPLLQGKSKNFRDQVKQSRNRVGRLGSVELKVVGEDLTLDEAFPELLRLHRSRWAEHSSFDTAEKVRFHRSVAGRLLEQKQLYLSLLTVDGLAVASRYDFVFDNKMWCIQGGWDPSLGAARPGLFMTEAAMSWAIDRGLREYDFLGGEGDYKQRWSSGSRELVTVVVSNPSTLRGRAHPLFQRAKARFAAARAARRQPGEVQPDPGVQPEPQPGP
jgi:CelD/BcsL family acetyltransferase involved in cellulose biosynthesis